MAKPIGQKYHVVSAGLGDSLFLAGEQRLRDVYHLLGLAGDYAYGGAGLTLKKWNQQVGDITFVLSPTDRPVRQQHLAHSRTSERVRRYGLAYAVTFMNVSNHIALTRYAADRLPGEICDQVLLLPLRTDVGEFVLLYPQRVVSGGLDIGKSDMDRWCSDPISCIVRPAVVPQGGMPAMFLLDELRESFLLCTDSAREALIQAEIANIEFRPCPE